MKTTPGLLALLVATACTSEAIEGTIAAPAPSVSTPVDVTARPAGDGTLAPPLRTPEPATRRRRRMDIDQLDTAIRQVTGGIGWTEQRGNNEVNLFQELARTLGKPDYLELVDEDLEPSAMFQKFLDDAARSVCDRLMEAERERSEDERVFFTAASPDSSWARAPDRVRGNLQYLVLRYHGRKLAVDAPELNPWLWLAESAEHVGATPIEMWRTVCVGLLTHPDFFTY